EVPQFVRAGAAKKRRGRKTNVVGNQPCSEADDNYQKRNNNEIASFDGHPGLCLPIRRRSAYCSSTYSRFSTARPASHSPTTVMPVNPTRASQIGGISWKAWSSALMDEFSGIACGTSACR